MTGFGRAEDKGGDFAITAEARSVNNRYLNIRLRVPPRYVRLESRLEEEVRKAATRGTIDVSVRVRGRRSADRPVVDQELAQSWLASIRALAEGAGLATDIRIESILGLPGVVSLEEDEDVSEREGKAVLAVAKRAIGALADMRSAEGARLADELTRLLARVEKLVAGIEARARRVPGQVKARFLKRIEGLLGAGRPLDAGVLEREVAVLADRCDITEEVARLKSHAVEVRATLARKTPIGRPLDFLVQEMAREANTVAAKNQDVEISRKVIELRSNIDRLREQVQNLE